MSFLSNRLMVSSILRQIYQVKNAIIDSVSTLNTQTSATQGGPDRKKMVKINQTVRLKNEEDLMGENS